MGMTIEEAISDLTALKICGVVPFTKGTISGGTYKVITEECLNTAINTMRKYQKIQEIINNAKDSDGAVKYNWLYEQISGVMEDGTD